ncbi:MAG TPA: AGE family epimerase/isomerase [Candidatus Sumerlaeota bacterium]|nr:AGE family epimerase/isomerase [Candidatus Sumerlaeota bacterium]
MSRSQRHRSIPALLCLALVALLPQLPARAAVPAEGFRIENQIPAGAQRVGMSWWATSDGISQTAATREPQKLLFGEKDWNDYSIRAQVQLLNPDVGSRAGLMLQAAGTGTYVAFWLIMRQNGPYAELRFEQSEGLDLTGDQSWLAELDLTQWHELRADVHGAEIACYVDDQPVASFWFAGTPPDYNSHGPTWENDPVQGRVGLITAQCAANFRNIAVEPLSDFSSIVTPQRGRRDAEGNLLPRWSYAETIRKMGEWMIHADEIVDKSSVPEAFRELPPYVLSNFVRTDDVIWSLWGEAAFNHSLLITGCVAYYEFTGDDRILAVARKTADWHLENDTPDDWALPHLPPSVVEFKEDGTWQGQSWGLELDKSAYFGLALLRLYGVTGDARYLDQAQRIADTLVGFQQEEGNWPFRVNAQTGEVQHGYACSQLWYVWFFNLLGDVTGEDAHRERADRALHWLLENPVQTNQWIGLYGDVPSGAETYDQWVALETAMYLLEHRDRYPDALEIAKKIEAFIEEKIMEPYGFHEGVPGVVEQSSYRVVLSHHQLRLAEFYATMYQATGDENYKQRAIETANSVTWIVMSDGKMRQGFWYHSQAAVLILSLVEQFMRVMACIPETAPDDESHLLRHQGLLNEIDYSTGTLRYRTTASAEEWLTLAGQPAAVQAGGVELPRAEAWPAAGPGWWIAPDANAVRIRHDAPDVQINFAD